MACAPTASPVVGDSVGASDAPVELTKPAAATDEGRPEAGLDIDCAAVAHQPAMCVGLVDAGAPMIVAVGLNDGASCPVAETHLDVRATSTLGLVGAQLVTCDTKTSSVLVLDPETGAVAEPGIACTAATAWRDGVLVADGPGEVAWFEDLDALLDDDPSEFIPLASSPGGVIATHGDVLVEGSSETDKVGLFGLPDGDDLGAVVTERAGGRLDGLALTDDGRIVTSRQGRIAIHDAATGALIREHDLGVRVHGLVCAVD